MDFNFRQQADELSGLFAVTTLNQDSSGGTYGDSTVTGQARVQNGNVYHSNTYHLAGVSRRPVEGKENDDLGIKLLVAASEGQLRRVRQLINDGADVNYEATHNSMTALQWCTLMGYDDVAHVLLEAGADVNCLNAKFGSALCLGALKGHLKVVRVLLAHRASVVAADDCALGSPLHCACYSGNLAILQGMLEVCRPKDIDLVRSVCDEDFEHAVASSETYRGQAMATSTNFFGADSDDEDDGNDNDLDSGDDQYKHAQGGSRDNTTPLMIAAVRGHVDLMSLLIEKGAKVKLRTPKVRKGESRREVIGTTALVCAAEGGQLEAMRLLLKHGAEVSTASTDGTSAFLAASYAGCLEGLKELVKLGASTEGEHEDGYNPLMLAAACVRVNDQLVPAPAPVVQDFPGTIRFLLDCGVDVNARSILGQTALMFMGMTDTCSDDIEIARLLLDAGAEVNAQDKNGYTALTYASRNAPQVAAYLMGRGADVKVRPEDGLSALHVAALFNHDGLVLEMMARGAETSWLGPFGPGGNTPLVIAAATNKIESVKALLELGDLQDIDTPNKSNMTPLGCACQNGYNDIARLLLEAGAKPKLKDLFSCITSDNFGLAKMLFKYNVDPNKGDRMEGQTPLHWAARAGSARFINLLTKHGAEVDAVDKDNRTPISFAAELGQHKAVVALMKAGADAGILDHQRHPLDAAAYAAAGGHVKVLKKLEEHGGISINRTYAGGDTLLTIGVLCGQLEVVSFLLDAGIDAEAVTHLDETPLSLAMASEHEHAKQMQTLIYSKTQTPDYLYTETETLQEIVLRRKATAPATPPAQQISRPTPPAPEAAQQANRPIPPALPPRPSITTASVKTQHITVEQMAYSPTRIPEPDDLPPSYQQVEQIPRLSQQPQTWAESSTTYHYPQQTYYQAQGLYTTQYPSQYYPRYQASYYPSQATSYAYQGSSNNAAGTTIRTSTVLKSVAKSVAKSYITNKLAGRPGFQRK